MSPTTVRPFEPGSGAAVVDEVRAYLQSSASRYAIGTDKYYARRALQAALQAFEKGNYGIGAVAVVQDGDRLAEYLGENNMVKGDGVVDHAETRALLRIAAGEEPDATFETELGPLDTFGIAVFGTLEPCPMSATTISNSGVNVSVSTALDGDLTVETVQSQQSHRAVRRDYLVSSGAANVIGDKVYIQPAIWRRIQQERGLRFELLVDDDPDLTRLSSELFLSTREQIDHALATKNPVGKKIPGLRTDAVRATYRKRDI